MILIVSRPAGRLWRRYNSIRSLKHSVLVEHDVQVLSRYGIVNIVQHNTRNVLGNVQNQSTVPSKHKKKSLFTKRAQLMDFQSGIQEAKIRLRPFQGSVSYKTKFLLEIASFQLGFTILIDNLKFKITFSKMYCTWMRSCMCLYIFLLLSALGTRLTLYPISSESLEACLGKKPIAVHFYPI